MGSGNKNRNISKTIKNPSKMKNCLNIFEKLPKKWNRICLSWTEQGSTSG